MASGSRWSVRTAAGKSTLFSLILGADQPDAGTIQRDEWTMVGYLPQESEDVGAESVLEVATGRAGEVPRLEARLHELEKLGDVQSPAYLEAHAKHDALSDPQVEAGGKAHVARARLPRERFRAPGARDERRLDHARAPWRACS